MERLSKYAASSPEVLPEFLQVEAFTKFSHAVFEVFLLSFSTHWKLKMAALADCDDISPTCTLTCILLVSHVRVELISVDVSSFFLEPSCLHMDDVYSHNKSSWKGAYWIVIKAMKRLPEVSGQDKKLLAVAEA